MADRRNALVEFRGATPARKLLYVLLAVVGVAIGYAAAHVALRGWGGPGASFDRAVDGDPNFTAIRALRDRMPDDYGRLRTQMVAEAEAGRSMEEIGRSGFTWMRNFVATNKPAMARAPSAELAAFRRGQIGATEALAATSREQCARFSMGTLTPADLPPANALPAIQRAAAAQVHAIAAGRREPAAPTPDLAPTDAKALVAGMSAQGLSDTLIARFAGPAGMATASPADQCEVGRKLLKSLDTMPAAQADRITAYLIAHS